MRSPATDQPEINIEDFGQLFLGNSAVQRTDDHVVFLDRRQAIDSAVVRVTLVIGGHQALHFALVQLSQRDQTNVAVEEEVLAWGDPRETLQAVLSALAGGEAGEADPELISVLAGEGAPLGLGALEGMINGGIELELRQGGQAAYWWLLVAE